MKSLTVYTQAYFNELEQATAHYADREIQRRLGHDSLTIHYEEFDAASFYELLERIAFQENAVLRSAPKLSSLTKEAVSSAMTNKNVEQLLEYVAENQTLHIEGYVRFRMAEHNNYLNFLLYSIMKRLHF